MGSSVNNNAANGGHEEVAFQSKDITSKTKAGQKKEYFVKFKEKTAGEKISEGVDKHKKKILIILGIVVFVALATVVIIKIIIAINQPKEKEAVEWATETQQVYDEIESYVDSSTAPDPYADGNAHYQELFNAESDPDKKFAIIISWGSYLYDQELYTEAAEVYSLANVDELDDNQLYLLYSGLWYVYAAQGKDEEARLYMELQEQYEQH